MVGQLDFAQTVAAGAVNALFTAAFTAAFVVIFGGIVVRWYEGRATDRRRHEEELHEEFLQGRQLEHQTRAALRETYARFLVAQRRSRQASIALADAGGSSSAKDLDKAALQAHDEFIDVYHLLNLDASREMWLDARGLRAALDDCSNSAKKATRRNASRS